MAPGLMGVELKHAESGRAYFAGLMSCGSVWTCAVCAEKIARKRQADVLTVLERHMAAGGVGAFLTLTVPHDRGAPLRELRRIVAKAWRGIQQGAPWQRAKARFGIVGHVRALESTHGGNGWHPHAHVLILLERPVSDAELSALHAHIFARWTRVVVTAGLRAPEADASRLTPIYSHADAASYVTKIHAVLELTRADGKAGKRAGRSPFEILASAGAGHAGDVALWREWCDGIKGARQLTWSEGLRDRYQLGAEASDEDAATAEVGGETAVIFSRAAWKHICRTPMLRADVLRAAERGGAADVLELLDSLPYWPADAAVTVLTHAGPLPLAA
jgi:hypothetical protein